MRIRPDPYHFNSPRITWIVVNQKMDHLTCFAGGLFGLAGQLLNSSRFAQLGKLLSQARRKPAISPKMPFFVQFIA